MQATLSLDDSAYRKGIEEVQSSTKQTVAKLSSEYSKAAQKVAELSQKYNESVAKTGKASTETKNLKVELASAQAQMKTTAAALKSVNTGMTEFGSSSKTTGESLAGAMTKASLLSSVITTLGKQALQSAVGFVQTGIEYNAQIEKYTTGFTNMLGSAEAAQQIMDQIQQDAAKTPFNVESLTKANQYLLSAGENATYARKTIMALGDAVSATGGGSDELNRMAQNLQQIANTGKATAVDIKQFAYAGINVYGILADYTGKSTAEVQNMTVSYDLLTKALQAASEEGGRYYNAMNDLSQTQNGITSTLQDNVKQLAGLLTSDLAKGIGTVKSNLNEMTVAAIEAYKTDGWLGLAGAITGLSGPIDSVKQKFNELGNAAITALDKASYWLNHDLLKKDAYSGYDSYEEYRADQDHQSNLDRRRQEALAGKGIYNQSWTERQAAAAQTSGSSLSGDSSGDSSKTKNKTVTKTVLSALTDAATSYSSNEYGQITTAVTELTEHIKDSTGKVYDQLTRTTTESGKELVNGVVKNYKLVTKQVTDENNKVTTTTQKTYEDASKTIASTLTQTSQTLSAGTSTTIEQVTQTMQDNSEQITQTATETGKRLVNGAWETYTKIKTIVNGYETDSKETTQAVVSQYDTLRSNYESDAKDVAELRAAYNESAASTGEFSEQTMRLAALLGEAEDALSDSKKAWEDYQKGTNRSYSVTKKFSDFLKSSNSSFSSFGSSLSNLGEFFDSETIQDAGDFFTTVSDGVEKVIDFASSTATLVETLQSLKETIDAVNATGGISSVVSGLGSILKAGGTAAAAGTAGAAATGTAAAGTAAAAGGTAAAAGGTAAAAGLSIPVIGMIVAGVLATAAVGYGVYKWATKNEDKTDKNKKLSYTDLQDAYWYGNERAFAGYDYRTDPYTFNPNNSTVLTYQTKMQEQLSRLTDVVQQYLPDVANQQIVLDDGTLVGTMTPKFDSEMGRLSALAERGN